MSIEKLSVEKINAITSAANRERGWRSAERRNFTDFTAVKMFENANLQSAELNYSDFRGITFKNCDLSRAEIRYANFENCTFERCRLDSVDGEFSQFKGAKFTDCLLDGNFTFANFAETELKGCALRSSELLYCNMEDASFSECEALNVRYLDMAKLPDCLAGLKYDENQYPNI